MATGARSSNSSNRSSTTSWRAESPAPSSGEQQAFERVNALRDILTRQGEGERKLRNVVIDLTSQLKEQKKTIQTLKNMADMHASAVEKKEEEAKQLSTTLEEKTTQLESSERNVEELQSSIEAIQAETDKTKVELTETKERSKKLEKTLNETDETLSETQTNLEDAQRSITRLEAQNSELSETCEQKDRQIRVAQKATKTAEKTLKTSQENLQKTQHENQQLKETKRNQQMQIDELQNAIEEQKTELTRFHELGLPPEDLTQLKDAIKELEAGAETRCTETDEFLNRIQTDSSKG